MTGKMTGKERRRPRAPLTSRSSGTHNGDQITNTILRHHEALCTVSARNAHEMGHFAAFTDIGTLARLAFHQERASRDLNAIGWGLPAALMLALVEEDPSC